MSIRLTALLEQRLTEVSIEQLKTQFVDSGKIDEKVFNDIAQTTNKSAYVTWLVKKVADGKIKDEDVYKFKEYFDIFNRHKRQFPSPDINAYGKKVPLADFQTTAVKIKRETEADPSKAKGVSRKKEDKYAKFVIGNVDGFTVYKIPKGSNDLKGVACDLGSGTEWCTAHSEANYFEDYIKDGPLYIFIKGSEKYQFHYESGQFMDKDDQPVI